MKEHAELVQLFVRYSALGVASLFDCVVKMPMDWNLQQTLDERVAPAWEEQLQGEVLDWEGT